MDSTIYRIRENFDTNISNLYYLTGNNPIYTLEQPILNEYYSNSAYANTLQINFPAQTNIKIIETTNCLRILYPTIPYNY